MSTRAEIIMLADLKIQREKSIVPKSIFMAEVLSSSRNNLVNDVTK